MGGKRGSARRLIPDTKTLQWQGLGAALLGSSSAEKALVVLGKAEHVPAVIHTIQCHLVAKKTSSILRCVKRTLAKGVREVIVSLCSSLLRPPVHYCVHFCTLSSSVLGLAGKGLTSVVAAPMVPCFAFVPTTVLGLLSATLLPHVPEDWGDHNFMVATAKADTGLPIPDQLFLLWEYQIQRNPWMQEDNKLSMSKQCTLAEKANSLLCYIK
ncbi:hypothetical protein QYF61_023736 [Mycteria americana]|uniref:Uncharacterized protein n=1 Tax=Mycteria americana TaxID=33587 RepID=A0AAN7RTT8_MYCAM|nr:hypothetical protein QYF61_023736 [Mycteria americana]